MADIQQIIANLTGQGDAVKFANELSSDLYPGEGYLKRGDALRHMLWQAKLQQKYGSLPAALAGHVYELAGAMEGQEGNESDMDLHNNEIGRRIGKESTNDADLVGRALQEIVEGRAKHYAGGGSVDAAIDDYSQLLDAYPNAKKFLTSLGANIEAVTPTQSQMSSPETALETALNFAPMGMAGVIKPKGGNWLKDHISRDVNPFKLQHPWLSLDRSGDPAVAAARIREEQQAFGDDWSNNIYTPNVLKSLDEQASINDWLGTKFAKYVQNEMATPEDPIRALAEKGILHYNPPSNSHILNMAEQGRKWTGYPLEPTATTDLGKRWEDMADYSIITYPAKLLQKTNIHNNPWLSKIDPESPVYLPALGGDLGIRHLTDELHNAIRHDSDLPANLRLDPSKLSKVSVPQAVELVDKINKYREAQKAEANLALARNPATHLHKEYPDQGYSWVELKHTPISQEERAAKGYLSDFDPNVKALEEALKYEGDTMGHCVGGYCPDVISGRSRIFSLRDAKGEPHVTIETRPGVTGDLSEDIDSLFQHLDKPEFDKFNSWLDEDWSGEFSDAEQWIKENYPKKYDKWLAEAKKSPESIVQIKGKSNRMPKEQYLPFVQDFVRSGKWSDIGDAANTGLSLEEINSLINNASTGYAGGGSVDIDHDHINSIIDAFNSEYGLRPDSTEKGRGYLNELKRPDGAVMTEFSIGMPIEGREMDIPTLVPSLTIDEIKSILSMPESGKIPRSIVQKAQEHAINRVKQGKSVFATPEESEFGER